jgi:hypothetical protein
VTLVIVVVIALVVIALVAFLARRRRSADGVDSFRRQIDALSRARPSPASRRPRASPIRRRTTDPTNPTTHDDRRVVDMTSCGYGT